MACAEGSLTAIQFLTFRSQLDLEVFELEFFELEWAAAVEL
jgi:hypothetical protein